MSSSFPLRCETAKQSIFSYRDKANQSIAVSLCFIMMACPCSKLLAENPFSTPAVDSFVKEKMTKEPGFLDDFINHNAYIRKIPLFILNPNTTNFILSMNHENEQGEKMTEGSEESEGAEALLPQPLIEFPLPLMAFAKIYNLIHNMNTGLDRATLDTMLNYIPLTSTPTNGMSIADMIRQLVQTLPITVNKNQHHLMIALSSILGIESSINISKPQEQQSLARLIVSYYTAINLNGLTHQTAQFLFNGFLLHATRLSFTGRLHATKDDLLGTTKPIQDHEILKENIKESAPVFTTLKLIDELHFVFFQQSDNLTEAAKSRTSVDPMLTATTTLLNYDVNNNGGPLYQRNIKSHTRMLTLIEENAEKKPQLVASNNQFMTLIYTIDMMLDPFVMRLAQSYVDNLSSYFSESGWVETSAESSGAEGKETTLFEIFKKVLKDAKENPGNEKPELFQDLLSALKRYIEQSLQKAISDEDDYQVIMNTLGTGFAHLLEQSNAMLAIYDEATKGPEPGKDEKMRKHLKERIGYLKELVDWITSNYHFAMKTPYDSSSSDSDSSDTDERSEDDMGEADQLPPAGFPSICWLRSSSDNDRSITAPQRQRHSSDAPECPLLPGCYQQF